MNIDAEITKKIKKQRGKLAIAGEISAPRLLINSTDISEAIENIRKPQQPAQRPRQRVVIF